MRVSWPLGVAVALGLSGTGHAATITVLSAGDLGPPAGYGSGATFDSVSAEVYGSTVPFGSFFDGGTAFSGSGVVMNNGGQGSLGLYATPYGDTTNYMAVLGGGSEAIAYSSLKNSFGLYWGSVDTFNSLAFYNGDTLVATITGADVDPPVNANGDQTGYASNGYVLITALPQFDRVVRPHRPTPLSSTTSSPEERRRSPLRFRSPQPGPCCCSASRVSAMRLLAAARLRSRPSPDSDHETDKRKGRLWAVLLFSGQARLKPWRQAD
jgi:hypothetical protein